MDEQDRTQVTITTVIGTYKLNIDQFRRIIDAANLRIAETDFTFREDRARWRAEHNTDMLELTESISDMIKTDGYRLIELRYFLDRTKND